MLVTDLADGSGALIARLHHSIAIGGLRMAEIFLTLEPDTAPPPETDLDATLPSGEPPPPTTISPMRLPPSGQRSPVPSVWRNRRRPNSHSSVRIRHESNVRRATRSTVRAMIDQLTGDPHLDNVGTLDAAPADGTSSPLRCRFQEPGLRPRHSGTINDLYVTALADAAIAYHAERGTEPRSVAMSFVRNTRTGSGAGGNAFDDQGPGPGGRRHSRRTFAALSNAMAPSAASGEPELGAVNARRPHPDAGADSPRPRPGRPDRRCHQQYLRCPVPIFVGDAHVLGTFPIGPVAGAACSTTVMSSRTASTSGSWSTRPQSTTPTASATSSRQPSTPTQPTQADDASALGNCAGLADVDRIGDSPVRFAPAHQVGKT